MYVVLCEFPDALNLIGPDCSSWTIPARGTSLRSTINPWGRQGIDFVGENNALCSRCFVCSLLAPYAYQIGPDNLVTSGAVLISSGSGNILYNIYILIVL